MIKTLHTVEKYGPTTVGVKMQTTTQLYIGRWTSIIGSVGFFGMSKANALHIPIVNRLAA